MTTKPSTTSLIPIFNPDLHRHIGIEQEFFLIDDSRPSPKSLEFLRAINSLAWKGFERECEAWTYEFSACQAEVRTHPHAKLDAIESNLHACDDQGMRAAQEIGVDLARLEVAPADMSMIHTSDERYDRLSKIIPSEVRLAAFRVAGTHFHLGMSCLEEAIEVHDALCRHLPELIAISDHSNGERLRLYHQVVSWAMPKELVPAVGASPIYGCQKAWLDYLKDANVAELRSCWDLVRITHHGTVELRALGIGENVQEILSWVEYVSTLLDRKIC